jgi:hypothetical protein
LKHLSVHRVRVGIEASIAGDLSEIGVSAKWRLRRGFYSLGLLHQWQQAGTERHWLMPLRKGAQYLSGSRCLGHFRRRDGDQSAVTTLVLNRE